MKFWDSSALVPLLVEEAATDALLETYRQDSDVLVWWSTPVECASAIARLERDDALSSSGVATALDRLRSLSPTWHEVQPLEEVRETASRLLRVHNLRAADALQLAAAFAASEHRPSTLEFVCLDDRLATAADREGFRVVRV